jgi:hypothetical protein
MKERYYNPSTADSYFAEQTSSTELIVCGERIVIENERLAKVFSGLPKLWQEVLVLYFFFGYTDKKIGGMYGKSRATVNCWKIAAHKQLKKKWRNWSVRNKKLISFEVVEKAVAREVEFLNAVLYHYRGYIKYRSIFQGYFNAVIQDRLKAQPIKAISVAF